MSRNLRSRNYKPADDSAVEVQKKQLVSNHTYVAYLSEGAGAIPIEAWDNTEYRGVIIGPNMVQQLVNFKPVSDVNLQGIANTATKQPVTYPTPFQYVPGSSAKITWLSENVIVLMDSGLGTAST